MKSFSSKVLLLGEHVVNLGAEALAIPYDSFYCKLSYDALNEDFVEESPDILRALASYIEKDGELNKHYHLELFQEELAKDLGFHMNIPIGYGLGSSGALVAAVFERYGKRKYKKEDTLKKILGQTESFFHGKSSGLDPLVSYLHKSVWIGDETRVVEQTMQWQDEFEIFLLNTHHPRKTGPLVEAFLEKASNDEIFHQALIEEIIPINNSLVHNFLQNKHDNTMGYVERLSALQLKHFKELILPKHIDLWMLGLASKEYFLKICGAGGGGFMLGFTHNKNVKLPFEVIWV